ncbi:hypothetical protein [Streptomyces cylindrosporus]|uniref:Uncharacterized protein n=1 Tax=Streptomyces cylindrosporus TaxID=2927583 RepID=A0ABS9YNR8_9ACTN|nr:hypothetical protein [Streptomyces cylindrosporus]MCI3277486.1 hypothetical protein [Streptomyces cylindrosporus]
MRPTFTRGFRLHHNGRIIHGAELPDGEVIVADDPQYGLGTAALSLEDLLKSYHGARVEWPGDLLVPTMLFQELVEIAAMAQSGAMADPRRARNVLGRLTTYLGYDVVGRAADALDAAVYAVHAWVSNEDAPMPCCGRTRREVPTTNRVTSNPEQVTCRGREPGESHR